MVAKTVMYGDVPVVVDLRGGHWTPADLRRMGRGRIVDEVVFHWTGGGYVASLAALTGEVSAHFLIPRAPHAGQPVRQLVAIENAAWHAGPLDTGVWMDNHHLLRYPDGRSRYNGNVHSIGIECVGGYAGNYEITEWQIEVMITILTHLCKAYPTLKPDRTRWRGHKELYSMKVDPGDLDIDRIVQAVQARLDAGSGDELELSSEDWRIKYIECAGVREADLASIRYVYDLLARGSDDADSAAAMRLARAVLGRVIEGRHVINTDGTPRMAEYGAMLAQWGLQG